MRGMFPLMGALFCVLGMVAMMAVPALIHRFGRRIARPALLQRGRDALAGSRSLTQADGPALENPEPAVARPTGEGTW